jgi:hypothetical protein
LRPGIGGAPPVGREDGIYRKGASGGIGLNALGSKGMDPASPQYAAELRRQQQLSDLADWYRMQPAVHEQNRSGQHVLVGVDHLHGIIRVEGSGSGRPHRMSVEERMEYDKDVLELVRQGLRNPRAAVILDVSDIAGRLGSGADAKRGLTANVLILDIDSGDVLESKTVIKEKPDFPEPLKKALRAVPRTRGESYIVLTTAAAERFVREYLASTERLAMEQRREGESAPQPRRDLQVAGAARTGMSTV